MNIPTVVTLICAVLICARLLTYRRNGARYRLGYSCAAWLLIAGTGTVAIRIITQSSYPAGWGIAIVMTVFACLVWRARGNVAHIIQLMRI